jgi:hypothetical protein
MFGKFASITILDKPNSESFRKQWDLTDKTFKFVQWLATIAAIAVVRRKTHDYVLAGVILVLLIMFALAWIRLLGGIIQTQVPWLDAKPWFLKFPIVAVLSLIPGVILKATFHVLDTIIAAQILR